MRVGCYRALYGAKELSYTEVSKVRFRGEHTVFPFIPEDKFARKNPVISLGRSFRLSQAVCLYPSLKACISLYVRLSLPLYIPLTIYLSIYLSM